jgi:hypothetical protein
MSRRSLGPVGLPGSFTIMHKAIAKPDNIILFWRPLISLRKAGFFA